MVNNKNLSNCLCIITGDKQYEKPYNRIGDTIDIQDCTKLNLDTQNFDRSRKGV
jgi:hypothetical protein